MQYLNELKATINDMLHKGCGILAADESTPTIEKRFNTTSTEKVNVNGAAY